MKIRFPVILALLTYISLCANLGFSQVNRSRLEQAEYLIQSTKDRDLYELLDAIGKHDDGNHNVIFPMA